MEVKRITCDYINNTGSLESSKTDFPKSDNEFCGEIGERMMQDNPANRCLVSKPILHPKSIKDSYAYKRLLGNDDTEGNIQEIDEAIEEYPEFVNKLLNDTVYNFSGKKSYRFYCPSSVAVVLRAYKENPELVKKCSLQKL